MTVAPGRHRDRRLPSCLASLNLQRLPFVSRIDGYHAQFANADGLRSGDDVRVEGMSVGKVTDVEVQGDHVPVDFTVRSGLALGARSHAGIEVATVLGDLFLQVESAGPGRLPAGGTIPVSRTTVPYTLITRVRPARRVQRQTRICPRCASRWGPWPRPCSGIAPSDAEAALRGLADLSRTLANKQQQIGRILTAAATITDTLNAQSGRSGSGADAE